MSDVPPRLITESLRALATDPREARDCIDVDALAAWIDGALRARERRNLQAHAAGCARCQALLAEMARTAPPSAPRERPYLSALQWLVPLATAAAAVTVWIAGPTLETPRPALPIAQLTEGSAQPAPVDSLATHEESKRQQPVRQERNAPPKQAEKKKLADAAAPLAAPSAPPPTMPSAQAAPPAAAAAALRAAPLLQSLAERAAVPTEIASPDRDVRWRASQGGIVEHTTNGGETWEAQPSGAGRIAAGAAPSTTTCWLVGERGLVLLSTDSRTWRRVSFPEAIDLTAIRASDASNAVVSSADGRTFTTHDGGRTWQSP